MAEDMSYTYVKFEKGDPVILKEDIMGRRFCGSFKEIFKTTKKSYEYVTIKAGERAEIISYGGRDDVAVFAAPWYEIKTSKGYTIAQVPEYVLGQRK